MGNIRRDTTILLILLNGLLLSGCGRLDYWGRTSSDNDTQIASSWQSVGTVGFTPGVARYQSLIIDENDTIFIAYMDYANSEKTTVAYYSGNEWQAVGSNGISTGQARHQSLAIDSQGYLYVAYQDVANGGGVTVKRFDGDSWETLGSTSFTGSAGDSTPIRQVDLEVDSNDIPYVAYRDNSNGQRVTVQKYASPNWQIVGTAGFSPVAAYNVDLEIDIANNPWVVFEDYSYDQNVAYVMSFQGSWQQQGSTLSATEGFSVLSSDSMGNIYLAYEDSDNQQKATVRRFNSVDWELIGQAGFSEIRARYLSLGIDKNNVPLIAYQRMDNERKITVRKYNGSSWKVYGNEAFSGERAYYLSLQSNSNGNPVVAYQDGENGVKATVMKYE